MAYEPECLERGPAGQRADVAVSDVAAAEQFTRDGRGLVDDVRECQRLLVEELFVDELLQGESRVEQRPGCRDERDRRDEVVLVGVALAAEVVVRRDLQSR